MASLQIHHLVSGHSLEPLIDVSKRIRIEALLLPTTATAILQMRPMRLPSQHLDRSFPPCDSRPTALGHPFPMLSSPPRICMKPKAVGGLQAARRRVSNSHSIRFRKVLLLRWFELLGWGNCSRCSYVEVLGPSQLRSFEAFKQLSNGLFALLQISVWIYDSAGRFVGLGWAGVTQESGGGCHDLRSPDRCRNLML